MPGIGSGSTGFEGQLVAVNVKGSLQGLVVGRESAGGELLGGLAAPLEGVRAGEHPLEAVLVVDRQSVHHRVLGLGAGRRDRG